MKKSLLAVVSLILTCLIALTSCTSLYVVQESNNTETDIYTDIDNILTEIEHEAGTVSGTYAQLNSSTSTNIVANAGTDTNTDVDAGTDADTSVDTDGDVDVDADADAEAGTGTDSDTDSDTEVLKDNMPQSSSFKGLMHYKTLEGKNLTCNIDFTVDYRDLIENDNEIYSKELSKLAILYSADIYDHVYIELTEGATGGNDEPTTFGTILGLQDAKSYNINSSDYAVDKDDVTQFVVGHKNIVYNGEVREVIIVSVRGTNETNAEWSSNFDVGADTKEYYDAVGYDHPHWRNKANHKGFDVTANRVYDELLAYIATYVDSNAQTSILITGHSRGAAIANILGQMFEDYTSYRTYGYTFAAPNTTTAANASSYKNIFNVINKDDIIPYLPIAEWNFTNYGVTKSISIKENYGTGFLEKVREGSFKWFTGQDYNDDGGTQRTLACFAALATCRDDLYKLDPSKDGKVYYAGALGTLGYGTYGEAQAKVNELKATLENEKLLKFCNIRIVEGGLIWKYRVELNYCPAYFMQILSNMTTGVGPLLGQDLSGKYNDAKLSFVASSGKVVIGGMEHPHMQPTYYLIVRNNFLSLDELNA